MITAAGGTPTGATDPHPLDEPDEWGDLASFLDANLLHKRTIPQEGVFRAT